MNPHEEVVRTELQRRGFEVMKRGWPDFLCAKRETDKFTLKPTGRYLGAFAVEVKAGADRVSQDQSTVHTILKRVGIPTYVVRPEQLAGQKFKSKQFRFWTGADFNTLNSRLAALERALDDYLNDSKQLRMMMQDAEVLLKEEANYEDDRIATIEENVADCRALLGPTNISP